MRKYRLQAGRRDATGRVTNISIDAEIWGADDAEAIRNAKMYQVSWYLDTSDYAWLTDGLGRQIWSLKLEEA